MNFERIRQHLLQNIWRTFIYLVLIFLVGSFFLSSLNTARSKGSTLGISGGYAPSIPSISLPSFEERYDYSSNKGAVPQSTGASNVNIKDRKIVQTGSLAIIVKEAEPTFEKISTFASAAGGFVEAKQTNTYQNNGQVYGSISIRVPAEKLEEVTKQVKELAVRVTSENINSDDVTKQYVDLEAQLKNLKAEEKQYLLLMERTGTVTEILQVSQQLANVRGRIEQTQSTLTYLEGQVAMSALTVSITAEAEAKIFGIIWSPLSDIKRGINQMIQDLVDYLQWLISFIFALPIIILKIATWGIIIWVIWKVFKVVKRKYFDTAPPLA